MAMDKDTMKIKIKQAFFDRTGELMSDDDSALIDICKGIIEELLANAEIQVTVVGGSSAGPHTGVILA